MGGKPAPLLYVSPLQINMQVPFDLPVNTQVQLIVQRSLTLSVPAPVVISAANPAVFTLNQTGTGPGAVLDVSFQLVSSSNPLRAGSLAIIFCTGLGPVSPPILAGVPAPGDKLSLTVNQVTATIGGRQGNVAFAGISPGFVGLYQVNVFVRSGIAPGDALPLVLHVAGQDSPPVAVAVR
jgi:uncharacterized protein (TIGR03437 family)